MRFGQMRFGHVAALIAVVSSLLAAEDIASVIGYADRRNPTLARLSADIRSKGYDSQIAALLPNPMLSAGFADISLRTPFKRDIEAMQTNFVTFSQEIVSSEKRGYNTRIKSLEQEIAALLLSEQKHRIARSIYALGYEIAQNDRTISLLREKIANIRELSAYHNEHLEEKKAFQDIIRNDLDIENIRLAILSKEEQNSQLYVKLSELAGKRITSLTISREPKYGKSIHGHILLRIQKLRIEQAKSAHELANANLTPNPTISGGYYQRDGRDDYLNLSVSMPLPVYGREERELAKSMSALSASRSAYDETYNEIESLYRVALSKRELALRALANRRSLMEHLRKEREFILSQNSAQSIQEATMLRNRIIESEIELLTYRKELRLAELELSYLTSRLEARL